MEQLPPGEAKVNEYVERIKNGEDKTKVLQGLPKGWIAKVEEKIAQLEVVPEFDGERRKLLDEVKIAARDIYFTRRNRLSDDMFMAAQGIVEREDGTEITFEKVSGKIGKIFDAHGIDKGKQLENLLHLLSNGIDTDRTFFTAPFEIPDENRPGVAAALGTSGGTAYKGGIAVLTSGPHQTLIEDGIKHVFINDVYGALVSPLATLYPQYQFHLLSEQKEVLERDFQSSAT